MSNRFCKILARALSVSEGSIDYAISLLERGRGQFDETPPLVANSEITPFVATFLLSALMRPCRPQKDSPESVMQWLNFRYVGKVNKEDFRGEYEKIFDFCNNTPNAFGRAFQKIISSTDVSGFIELISFVDGSTNFVEIKYKNGVCQKFWRSVLSVPGLTYKVEISGETISLIAAGIAK